MLRARPALSPRQLSTGPALAHFLNPFYADRVASAKHVLIVGCPRSGTSWLQLLLAQHPNVATTQETHLFSGYLRHLRRAWRHFKSLPVQEGMTLLFSDADFDALCADFAKKVFQRIADTNAAATVVLEKTPGHARDGAFILQLLPEVYFIHIIRDPRSVVSSLSAAARSWGWWWASSSVVDNARLWRSHVTCGREISALTPRYREVRYEDLLSSAGPEVLEGLFSWLDLPADREFSQAALTACQIDRLRQGGHGVRAYESLKRTQADFFRRGQADGWKDDLPPGAIAIVEHINRDLLTQCGYSSSSDIATRSTKPFRLAAYETLEWVERRVRRRMDAAFKKARSVL
jgi:Sulfotransferase family